MDNGENGHQSIGAASTSRTSCVNRMKFLVEFTLNVPCLFACCARHKIFAQFSSSKKSNRVGPFFSRNRDEGHQRLAIATSSSSLECIARWAVPRLVTCNIPCCMVYGQRVFLVALFYSQLLSAPVETWIDVQQKCRR
jgi:hypothetical protein